MSLRGLVPRHITYFAADQLARIIIVLDDVDITASLRVSLHYREFSVSECFYKLRLAVEVIIMDLADENPMRVFLHEIDPSVEVPITFNLDELIVVIRFDDIGPSVAVSVDRKLVGVFVDLVYPSIGSPVAAQVHYSTVGFGVAGDEAESQSC